MKSFTEYEQQCDTAIKTMRKRIKKLKSGEYNNLAAWGRVLSPMEESLRELLKLIRTRPDPRDMLDDEWKRYGRLCNRYNRLVDLLYKEN